LAAVGTGVEDLRAVAGRLADKVDQAEGEVVGTLNAGLLSQAEVHASGTVEAQICDRVDVGFVDRATGQVILDASSKDLSLILSSSDITIDPIFGN